MAAVEYYDVSECFRLKECYTKTEKALGQAPHWFRETGYTMAFTRKVQNQVLKAAKIYPPMHRRLCRRWNVNTIDYWNDKYAPNTAGEEWRSQIRLQFYELAAGAIPRQPASILDVGSGLGWGAAHLHKICEQWTVEGLDFSAEACRKAVIKTHCVDLRLDDLPYEYDYVVAIETLEHFNNPIEIVDRLYEFARKAVILVVPYAGEIGSLHPARFDEHSFDKYPHVRTELSHRQYAPAGEAKTDLLAVLSKAPGGRNSGGEDV